MKSYLTLFIITLINLSLYAQQDNSIVAQIGKDKITARDFKLRFELSPYIPDDKYMYKDSVKYDFLYSWVAEKLWANEAERFGIDKTEKFNFYFKPIEELFVRDALFKKEVEDKVKLSADDINSGITKSQSKLSTQAIYTNDSTAIWDFYSQLKSSNNFDSLLSFNHQLSTKDIEVSLGSLMDEEIEDSLYSLGISQNTQPIHSEIGWVIFLLKNKIFSPVDLSDKKFINDMKKTIRNRRIQIRYKEYLNEILAGTKIDLNPESFKLIFDLIWNKIKNNAPQVDSVNYFEVRESDFESIINNTAKNDLSKTLFSLHDKNVDIESFLGQFAFDGFNVEQLDSLAVLNKLSYRAKHFVENQLITEEGYKQKLNLNPEVRNELAKWKENYLAQSYYNMVLDSINIKDSDVHEFYLNEFVNASNIKLVNVRLVSLKNLDEVSNVLDSLKNGKDFGDVIRKFGSTDSLVNGNGETGLRPVLMLGYIGKLALDLKLNEVYGPVQRNNAYTIMQVIERKDTNDSLKFAFEEVKNKLKDELRIKKLKERLKGTTASLSEKYDVKIFNNVLDQVQTSSIPMFVHRLMGFGGRIAGVPVLTPFSGWIQNSEKKKIFP